MGKNKSSASLFAIVGESPGNMWENCLCGRLSSQRASVGDVGGLGTKGAQLRLLWHYELKLKV